MAEPRAEGCSVTTHRIRTHFLLIPCRVAARLGKREVLLLVLIGILAEGGVLLRRERGVAVVRGGDIISYFIFSCSGSFWYSASQRFSCSSSPKKTRVRRHQLPVIASPVLEQMAYAAYSMKPGGAKSS